MTLFEKALGVVKVEMLERMRGVNSMNAASFKWKPLREIVAADSLWPSSQVARLKSAPTMDRSFGARDPLNDDAWRAIKALPS